MHNEQIIKAWRGYLKNMLEPNYTGEKPWLFSNPFCGICAHWFIVRDRDLHHLATKASPREYDEIINDLSGNRLYDVREEGDIIDHYRAHRFYGWCKRYPPTQQGGYSIIGFRSIFTFLNRNIPQKVAEYDFPLMPHDSQCGEWKKGNWVDSFVKENTGKAPQSDAQ